LHSNGAVNASEPLAYDGVQGLWIADGTGFAKSAHSWLISSHPFGVEEFRPIGGAEWVAVFMAVCT